MTALPFLVQFLSNLMCRFTLPGTRTNFVDDPTRSDLRACT